MPSTVPTKCRVHFHPIVPPDESGFDPCGALRKIPETAGALIVAITSHLTADFTKLTQEVGFDHYLVKPVPLDTILETMHTLINARRGGYISLTQLPL